MKYGVDDLYMVGGYDLYSDKTQGVLGGRCI